MKKYYLLFFCISILGFSYGQNVGIGTSNPIGAKLHIKQSLANSSGGIRLENPAGTTNAQQAALDTYQLLENRLKLLEEKAKEE